MKKYLIAAAVLLTLSVLCFAACRRGPADRESMPLQSEIQSFGEGLNDKAESVKETLKDEASKAAETVKDRVSVAAETVKDGLTEASERMSEASERTTGETGTDR